MSFNNRSQPSLVVAIPANNEADRIGACLAALIVQRHADGAPLPTGTFSILVFANNCRDETAREAVRWGALSPYPIVVVEADTLPEHANAGMARRRAMDLAAEQLDAAGRGDGAILTTDADSCVSPTWIAATLDALAGGADAVAGYIDAHPVEIVRLGPAFLQRGRLEDRYLRLLAEIEALGDPRRHNPWPTHRVSSGASLAVTLHAYRAVDGLPGVALGEDIAMTRALDRHGFKVRHAPDVVVSTSCRLDGRATGGAADTMRLRHADIDAPCGEEIEPAGAAVRRAISKGRLRAALAQAHGAVLPAGLADRLWVSPSGPLWPRLSRMAFTDAWAAVEQAAPARWVRKPLRPSELPLEIGRAERLLMRMRGLRAAQGLVKRSSR